jgi:hypothetical protein
MHEEAKNKLIEFFFRLRNNLYLYHLSTYKYSRHVAVGTLVDTFDGLTDKFLEIFFGKYGRPDRFPETMIKLCKLSDTEALFELGIYIEFLNNDIPMLVHPVDTDLLNIRDEMVGVLNNNKYLFLLN